MAQSNMEQILTANNNQMTPEIVAGGVAGKESMSARVEERRSCGVRKRIYKDPSYLVSLKHTSDEGPLVWEFGIEWPGYLKFLGSQFDHASNGLGAAVGSSVRTHYFSRRAISRTTGNW